jgi:hypothetical protein
MVYKCTRDYFSNENGIIKIVPSLGIAQFGVSSILHISPYTLWVVWGGGGGQDKSHMITKIINLFTQQLHSTIKELSFFTNCQMKNLLDFF